MPARAEPGVRLLVWALEEEKAKRAVGLGRLAARCLGRRITCQVVILGGPNPEADRDALDAQADADWSWQLRPARIGPVDRLAGP